MSQAAHTWSEGAIEIAVGRTVDVRFRLFTADRAPQPIAIGAGDVVRFKLSRAAGDPAPLLDLSSAAATEHDSRVEVTDLGEDGETPASVLVRFAQGDTAALVRGSYHGELCLVDDSETHPVDAIKRVAHGPVLIVPAPGGATGLT